VRKTQIPFELFSGLLIFLVAISFLLFLTSNQQTNSEKSDILKETYDVWIYNCELPEQKPKTILLTCADGGIRIEQLTWTTWSSTNASGYGTYLENNCVPDCSEGEYKATKVNLMLDNLTQHKGKHFFKNLNIVIEQDQKQFPSQITPVWDIFKFGQMMNM
jgi:hypothetical protein